MDLIAYELKFAHSDLSRVPAYDKAIFLALGHVANELFTLGKYVLLSNDTEVTSDVERYGRTCQSFLLIKSFAIAAVAGWEFLSKQLKRTESQDFIDDHEGIKADDLRQLESYFAKANLLKFVRDKLTAHLDVKFFESLMNNLPNQDYSIYLTTQQGNSLYYASTEVVINSLMERANDGEAIRDVLDRLVDDVQRVSSLLTACAQGMNIFITKKYFPNLKATEVGTISLVSMKDIQLPFFVDLTDS